MARPSTPPPRGSRTPAGGGRSVAPGRGSASTAGRSAAAARTSGGRGSSSTRDRYGRPAFRRPALAPGLLGAIALLAGFALLDTDPFLIIRFVAAILALIIAWFAIQARHWWWLPFMLAVAVIWNPAWPLPFSGTGWLAAQYLGVLVFVLAGVLIKVPTRAEDDRR